MVRAGTTIINLTPSDYTFITTPETCRHHLFISASSLTCLLADNYNAYVGAASTSFVDTYTFRFD